VHMWDVHVSYMPPPPFDTMFGPATGPGDKGGHRSAAQVFDAVLQGADVTPQDKDQLVDSYDGEIRYVDEHLGKLFQRLRELGEFDNSLIVVTADHGDEFFEHGYVGHRRTLYDEVLRVPLIFRYPTKLKGGVRVPDLVRLEDVTPTIASLLDLGISDFGASDQTSRRATLHGRALTPFVELAAESPVPNLVAVGDLTVVGSATIASLRSPDAKLIVNADEDRAMELYDLQADALERTNLIERNPDKAAKMLDQWRELTADLRRTDSPGRWPLNEEAMKKLRSLGYIK